MSRPECGTEMWKVSRMTDISRLPTPVSENWEWQQRAACREHDSRLFFHPEPERGLVRQLREERAKAICRRCPVIVECRRHALFAREPYGVWGAMTERERMEYHRRHRVGRGRWAKGNSVSGTRCREVSAAVRAGTRDEDTS